MGTNKPNPFAPHSRHRRSRDLLTLPEGRSGRVPSLPSGRAWTTDERALWRDLWRSPQAFQWDDSYAPSVAMYVVHSCAVLAGTASAWQAQEARHLGDRLGLTPQGLTALGWRLPDRGDEGTARVTSLPTGALARARLAAERPPQDASGARRRRAPPGTGPHQGRQRSPST